MASNLPAMATNLIGANSWRRGEKDILMPSSPSQKTLFLCGRTLRKQVASHTSTFATHVLAMSAARSAFTTRFSDTKSFASCSGFEFTCQVPFECYFFECFRVIGWRPSLYTRLEAISIGLEAIAIGLEAIAIRLEAIAIGIHFPYIRVSNLHPGVLLCLLTYYLASLWLCVAL